MGAKKYDALKDKEIVLSKNSTTEKGIISMPDSILKMRKKSKQLGKDVKSLNYKVTNL